MEPVFAERSFCFLKTNNSFRRCAIRLITWRWFERFSILMILFNSLTLGMADPCDTHCEKTMCYILEIAEHGIYLFFVTEMLIKMLAMGVFGKNAYFGEYWNCFDFFIVIIGVVEYIFAEQHINLSAIRALRVLRPLRAINRIPSLRLLVTLILDILPMLGNVMIFCAFIFFVFGIISVQLWAGVLRQRCFIPVVNRNSTEGATTAMEKPPDFMPPYYELGESEFVCSNNYGMQTCDQIPEIEKHMSMCNEMFWGDLAKLHICRKWVSNYSDCRPDGLNPGMGTTNFDNMLYAALAIFQVISLEGWVGIMYYIQDAFSFWAWIYFLILVLLGSYFLVKLCLVVIAAQFSVTRLREKERMRQERLNKAVRDSIITGKPIDITSDESKHNDGDIYAQILDLIAHYTKKCCSYLKSKLPNCCLCKCKEGKQPARAKHHLCFVRFNNFQVNVRHLLEGDRAQAVLAIIIIANAVIMSAEHYGQPDELTEFIEMSNYFFTIIFAVEFIVKLFALGPESFIREPYNALDGVVVIINVAELLSNNRAGGLSVLRLFRLFRLVKILRFFPVLQRQLLLMLHTVDNVASFFLLLGFALYNSALLGMSLFGCKFCQPVGQQNLNNSGISVEQNFSRKNFSNCQYLVLSNGEEQNLMARTTTTTTTTTTAPPHMDSAEADEDTINVELQCSDTNFDSLFNAIFTVLQIFTRDGWGSVMKDGMHFTSEWASLYFVVLVTIGDYVIFNLLIGILVEGFSSRTEEEIERKLNNSKVIKNSIRSGNRASRLSDEGSNEETASLTGKMHYYWNGCRDDRSLFIFRRSSPFRKFLYKIISSVYFESLSLVLTLGSCIVIMLERPAITPGSDERFYMTITSNAIAFAFLLEAFAKIIAKGFIFGRHAYLRNGWNMLDFGLLILAGLDIIAIQFSHSQAANKVIIYALRPVRLLRALRPLRLISRTEGLKLVLQTLVLSLRSIAHIILICCFFFVIFAILGVQLFSGCFARCVIPRYTEYHHMDVNLTWHSLAKVTVPLDELERRLATVTSHQECSTAGLMWEVESYNFDSLPNALITLFVFATLDGWSDITHTGGSCVGPGLQPQRGFSPWSYLYFISFLLIVCFFALNMFVGVVVNNFQKVQRKLQEERGQAERAIRAEKLFKRLSSVITQTLMATIHGGKRPMSSIVSNTEKKPFWASYPKWRLLLYRLVSSKKFEYFFISAVILNVATMALEFHNQPRELTLAIDYFDVAILGLIFVEMVLKVTALGPWRYITDRWNQLDLVVTLLSVVEVVLSEMDSQMLPVNPSVVRIVKIFRIARILKIWRAATNLHRLLDTVSQAIPQVINLSLLFILLFFIYASLGVQLYSRFDCHYENCKGLSRHANFENFGMALLALFRIFTGDDWNLIMRDAMRLSQDSNHCHADDSGSSGLPCGLIIIVSPFYFISFVLFAQFILINIFVAVLMQQIENMHKANLEDLCKQQTVIEDVKAVENEALADITAANDANQVIDIPGFSLSEAVSIVSTDYVLRQTVCDADYLTARLRRLAFERVRRGETTSCHSFLSRSATTCSGLHRSDSLLSSSPSMLCSSTSLTIHYDPEQWRRTAAEVRAELTQSPASRPRALAKFIERRRHRYSPEPSLSTLRWDYSSTMASLCISEKLSEFASTEFDTWT